jgi:DNA-binding NarL/FixJ family response regulator
MNAPLQRRQLEILQLAAEGPRYKQIGRMLSISAETVKNQMASIFERLGAHDKAHAVAVAMREGWVQ